MREELTHEYVQGYKDCLKTVSDNINWAIKKNGNCKTALDVINTFNSIIDLMHVLHIDVRNMEEDLNKMIEEQCEPMCGECCEQCDCKSPEEEPVELPEDVLEFLNGLINVESLPQNTKIVVINNTKQNKEEF